MNLSKINELGINPLAAPATIAADIRKGWSYYWPYAHRKDSQRGEVVAANSYAGSLITQYLIAAAITPLQNRLAPLKCFSRDFSTDPFKPLATTNLKYVASGATGQTNPTNWESGDSTITDVQTTINQYSQSFHITQSDLDSGMRMADLIRINVMGLANTVIQAVTAPITAANFSTLPPVVRSPANFSWSDMQTAGGSLKKSDIKNAVLDGEYMVRIENVPTQFQRTPSTDEGKWGFGWDEVVTNTNWTGADPYVRGFCCNPQAIGVVAGLPLAFPNFNGALERNVFELPGLELSVAMYSWFSLATRAAWVSFDVMLGANALDTTAGLIVRSQ